jgi:hypothetical protein
MGLSGLHLIDKLVLALCVMLAAALELMKSALALRGAR